MEILATIILVSAMYLALIAFSPDQIDNFYDYPSSNPNQIPNFTQQPPYRVSTKPGFTRQVPFYGSTFVDKPKPTWPG